MIDTIKSNIKSLLGERVSLQINIGRNKEDFCEGIIMEMYPYIFTVKVGDLVKSFSYNDVLTRDVIIRKI